MSTLASRLRRWSLDEPEIANVADGAVITGPGYEATAAVIRSGDLLPRDPPPPLAPPVPPLRAIVAVVLPPPLRAPPAPVSPPSTGANQAWLAFGGAIAAACLASVLVALRHGQPASRVAAP